MERRFSLAGNGPLMLITALLSILVYHVLVGQPQRVSADFAPIDAGQAPTGGTDKGPKWTVTPVMWGDATKQYLCVIKEGGKDAVGIQGGRADLVPDPTYMAIYQLKSNGPGMDVELVGNRQVDYDLRLPISMTVNNKLPTPFDAEREGAEMEKKLAQKAEKDRLEREKKDKEKKDEKKDNK